MSHQLELRQHNLDSLSKVGISRHLPMENLEEFNNNVKLVSQLCQQLTVWDISKKNIDRISSDQTSAAEMMVV